MKKLTLLLALVLLIGGCSMTRDEMRKQKEFCEDIGLEWEYIPDSGRFYEKVKCIPKKLTPYS